MPVSDRRNRVCQNCQKEYELGAESTLHKYCTIECRKLFHADRWKTSKRDPSKRRAYWLKHKYNMNPSEFEKLLAAQNNSCAICQTYDPVGYGWHVDHSHKTGTIRGILCPQCNQALGMFKDDITTITKAIKYLENHTNVG